MTFMRPGFLLALLIFGLHAHICGATLRQGLSLPLIKNLLTQAPTKTFRQITSEDIVESLEKETPVNKQAKASLGEWVQVFDEKAAPENLHKNIHVIYHDNALPEHFFYGLLSLCSEALESGWKVHFWTNKGHILNTFTTLATNGFEDKLSDLKDAIEKQAYREKLLFAKKENIEPYVETILRGYPKQASFLKEVRRELDRQNSMVGFCHYGPAHQLKTLSEILKPQASRIPAGVYEGFPQNSLRTHFASFFTHEFAKDQVQNDLLMHAVQNMFDLDLHASKKRIQTPPEVRDHLLRLQKHGKLIIHDIQDVYDEAQKILAPDLYSAIRSIQHFEGGGLKNYGSLTDIDRKLVLMIYGGLYCDLDGFQVRPLPQAIPQTPHACRLPYNNNDPYLSHPSRELWSSILWEIVSRYEAMINIGVLGAKKAHGEDQSYTVFATGPGLMCMKSGCGEVIDHVIQRKGFFPKLLWSGGRKSVLKYDDFERAFILDAEPYNALVPFGVQYVSKVLGRAVCFANSWVDKSKRKKPSFVTPDSLPA